MASQTQICNMALSHLGAEAQVANIDPPDGSVEAGLCRTFYSAARQEALELAAPRWASKRVVLAEVGNPSTMWLYAYALPSDCLSALRVLPTSTFDRDLWPIAAPVGLPVDPYLSERAGVDFEIEGGLILTNEPNAVLKYLTDVTDTTRYSAQFATAFSMLLASYLAGPIIKGTEGAKIGVNWRQAAVAALNAAGTSDANEGQEQAVHIPDQIKARA